MLVRENADGRVAGPDAAAVHAPGGRPLNIGEKITGHYTLEPVKPGDTVIFLGTGTGEAPHNYMLWELLTPRAHGQDPDRLLRPLRARPRLLRHARRLMRRFPNYTVPGADHPRGGHGRRRRSTSRT